jgi:tetratricopeptide (TPR) repeat protein
MHLNHYLRGLWNLENNLKQLIFLAVLALILVVATGCGVKKIPPSMPPEKIPLPKEKVESGKPVRTPPQPSQSMPPAPPTDQPVQAKPDPRMLAAANLVDQGKTYLDNGKPDQALDVLERALSVDPSNGRTYYYMAEAWIMKKNKKQAMEFNRLAAMYLTEDRQWSVSAADQQRRIQSMQ